MFNVAKQEITWEKPVELSLQSDTDTITHLLRFTPRDQILNTNMRIPVRDHILYQSMQDIGNPINNNVDYFPIPDNKDTISQRISVSST